MSSKWPSVELAELLEHQIGGLWGEPAGTSEEDALVVRITELRSNGGVDFSTAVQRSFTKKQVESRRLRAGDILLEKSGGGPNSPVGRVALIEEVTDTMVCTNFMLLMRPDNVVVDSKYLHQFLTHFHSSGQTAEFQSNSTNIRNISVKDYLKIKVPLPPLDEQKRIVAKLDQALGYVDELDTTTKSALQEVDSFWKVSLTEAFSPAAHQNQGTLVSDRWPLARIGDICSLFTGGTPSKAVPEYFEGGQIPWLVSGDVNRGEILECDGRITELGLNSSNAKYLPLNSVVIALAGQGKTRGTVAILRIKATCNQSVVAMSPKDEFQLLPEFLFWNLRGRYVEIRRLSGDDERDRRGLNMDQIKSIEIPLPPIDEQKRIVGKLEKIKSELDGLRGVKMTTQAESTSIRSAILSAAFAGDL